MDGYAMRKITTGDRHCGRPRAASVSTATAHSAQSVSPPGASGEAAARLRRVEIGEVVGAQVSVTRGLQNGDRVIVRGASLAHDGAAVQVIP